MNDFNIDINNFNEIEKFIRQERDQREQTLAEIITKYDFIVGSIECKYRLMKVFPEGVNIICSRFIDDPTTVYAIPIARINMKWVIWVQ